MRVISGTARGRRLRAPKGNWTRPTSKRVKEAIFDILGAEVRGARVLDLFAGSGGLGIEALSREARLALFVDSSRNAADLIRRNLKGLGFADRSEVWRTVHISALRRMGRMGYKFDLIFSDPPYQSGLTEEILRRLEDSGAVVEGGIVVTECWKKEKLSGKVGRFTTFLEKTYGETKVVFWIFEQKTKSKAGWS